ncbi:hypothetical protein AEQ67_18430 [Pseudomonas sp. RIT-PI-q]|uniref:hypothetical protein n=1 Tax=Pseudomonas sp. RIT-PI-q TaxID=1690247 RepID=UPI0006CD40B6|nr:hypothetical protein [Pseudomonas sp. RIT-PI-q]KPG95925.1 hypothetical protein AEQ67_18430 [Pseudomonas sp. RIT-PI-q]
MNWKDQIQEHYRKKEIKEQGYTRDQIDSFYADAVLPAFEEIKKLLSQFVSNVSIKKYTYKATFRFEESEMYKSVFRVEVSLRGSGVAFPFQLNDTYVFGARVKADRLDALDKDFIIFQFIEFFKIRERHIADLKLAKQ